jgi:predicted enzyme related to lactoylglutathione lyase
MQIPTHLRFAIVASLLLGGSACANRTPTLPSISPTPVGPHLEGRFVWRDLLTDDLPAIEAFYSGLFGWQFRAGDEGGGDNYRTVHVDGRPIAGVFVLDAEQRETTGPQWISSISIGDVDAATETVRRRGGTVHRGPLDVPPRGRMAVVSDPMGAVFALVRTAAGDPAVGDARENGWLWTELWTTDVAGSTAFYRELAGYETTRVEMAIAPNGYTALTREDEMVAGVLEYKVEGVRPNWLPYVRVLDADATAARALELGGTLLIPPDPNIRDGSAALIADPSGAAFVIQEWTPGEGSGR